MRGRRLADLAQIAEILLKTDGSFISRVMTAARRAAAPSKPTPSHGNADLAVSAVVAAPDVPLMDREMCIPALWKRIPVSPMLCGCAKKAHLCEYVRHRMLSARRTSSGLLRSPTFRRCICSVGLTPTFLPNKKLVSLGRK